MTAQAKQSRLVSSLNDKIAGEMGHKYSSPIPVLLSRDTGFTED